MLCGDHAFKKGNQGWIFCKNETGAGGISESRLKVSPDTLSPWGYRHAKYQNTFI